MTTKIHTVCDGQGRPLRFIITAGQQGDITTAPALLDGFKAGGVIADKAYDSNALRTLIHGSGAQVVIPCNPTRKIIIPHDRQAYRLRNRIERFFNKLKHFRRIATRYDRRALYFLAAVQLASSMIWMR